MKVLETSVVGDDFRDEFSLRIRGLSLSSTDLEFEEILQIEENKSDFSDVQHFSCLFYSYKFLKKNLIQYNYGNNLKTSTCKYTFSGTK